MVPLAFVSFWRCLISHPFDSPVILFEKQLAPTPWDSALFFVFVQTAHRVWSSRRAFAPVCLSVGSVPTQSPSLTRDQPSTNQERSLQNTHGTLKTDFVCKVGMARLDAEKAGQSEAVAALGLDCLL
jgi:hypothetical protein